jgi:PIN domain nuclease of toxin-antitoxin system
VSAATAWEIATKVRIGKLQLAEEFLQNFLDAVEALGFRPLPISLRHGYEAIRLPGPHIDPFDLMLAAQSLAEDLVLVSADPAFNALGVSTFW